MEGRGGIRRVSTHTQTISRVESSNLRDLFSAQPDNDDIDTTPTMNEKRDLPSSSSVQNKDRTVFDVIRQEKEPLGVLIGSSIDGSAHHINWKVFRDRLRLRRASAVWASAVTRRAAPSRTPSLRPGSPRPAAVLRPTLSTTRSSAHSFARPESNILAIGSTKFTDFNINSNTTNNNNNNISISSSNNRVGKEEEDDHKEEAKEEEEEEMIYPWQQQKPQKEPMAMSLMALLEQSDMMGGLDDDDEDEEDMAEIGDKEEEEEVVELESECCVCMVKHKGAPFKTCGHSFCRLCSRELLVDNGTCSLCDGFVLEILHVF